MTKPLLTGSRGPHLAAAAMALAVAAPAVVPLGRRPEDYDDLPSVSPEIRQQLSRLHEERQLSCYVINMTRASYLDLEPSLASKERDKPEWQRRRDRSREAKAALVAKLKGGR